MSFRLITGAAGTGKTWMVREEADADPLAVLAATTGIAAINLGGSTINSLLQYFDTDSIERNYDSGVLQRIMVRRRACGIAHYYLDEVSMLSGRVLDYLVAVVNDCNLAKSRHQPEITLTLVGDFGQLPPASSQETYAFMSSEWVRFSDNRTHLTTIRRQSDSSFINALRAVREGRGADALPFFQSRLCPTISNHFPGVTLRATNALVDEFNDRRVAELETPMLSFDSLRTGTALAEWAHIPRTLHLRTNSLVMILANCRDKMGNLLYVNGDLGELAGMTPDGAAEVVLKRTGATVLVSPVQRQNTLPTLEGRRMQVIGTLTYMPLRLAYASTVHKAQGLSLDSVQVDLRAGFFRSPGMLYTALSRARTAEGLRLVGTPEQFVRRCSVNERAAEWL